MEYRIGSTRSYPAFGLLFLFLHFLIGLSEADLDPSFDGTLNNIQYQGLTEQLSTRHVAAKAKLMVDLKKPRSGEFFDEGNPRYDLLWGLHGLFRYRERHLKDVFDWEAGYGQVTEEQKEASLRPEPIV
jgi:hypothetical protein